MKLEFKNIQKQVTSQEATREVLQQSKGKSQEREKTQDLNMEAQKEGKGNFQDNKGQSFRKKLTGKKIK